VVENSIQRRLAAILAADVVGYSRLMGQDETGTLVAVRNLRTEVLEPHIAQHNGNLFKVMGDGFLAEFSSVVNAVACAMAIQRAVAARTINTAHEPKTELRIGIHLGDVIVEGGDVYGDGVNTAVRIEGLSPPGGLAVSALVHESIGNRLDLAFEDMGHQQLKNIAKPVHVYRLGLMTRQASKVAPSGLTKPSIAVLPFANMSGDPDQEYFSDGITEDIITELSRFRGLSVIARNSSFSFKGKSTKVQEIGDALSVAYVVEGSVRKLGPRIRITAQLISALDGSHLWAERYDQDIDDVFAIQDDIVSMIVARVAGQIASDGTAQARRKRTDNLAAYESVLRGMEHWRDGAINTASDFFQKAIDLDPDFAWAYARLAFFYLHCYFRDLYEGETARRSLALALETAKKAVVIDGNDSECHRALGMVYLNCRSFELARRHLETAATLNPNDVGLATNRAIFEAYVGRPQRSLEILDHAERLEPQPQNWHWEARGLALYQLKRYDEAIASFDRMTTRYPYINRWRAACYAQLGLVEEAKSIAAETMILQPNFNLKQYAGAELFQSQADLDHLVEGLRKAGLPE
jgi:adenylate cyclase